MYRILLFLVVLGSALEAQKITVIGVGRLGLCLALCLEKAGYEVVGVDLSPEYVQQLNEKTFSSPEPQVNEYLLNSRNFLATTSLEEGLSFSDVYFVVVPTNPPSMPGEYNCKALDRLLLAINQQKVANKHIIITSTLAPGYISNIARPTLCDCAGISISYNPEFIAQGAIIKGLQNPDIILIGQDSEEKARQIEEICQKIATNQPYIARMSPESAEITKLSLNCFVTMKIAFANLVADIADATAGADKHAILNALGNDQRIGGKALKAGYGFGGPCFPRDNRAMGKYAQFLGIEPTLFRATEQANLQHAEYLAGQFMKEDLAEYIFEDVSYKPNCPVPIIEESHKLLVAKIIATAGKQVVIKDRAEIIEKIRSEYGDLFEYTERD